MELLVKVGTHLSFHLGGDHKREDEEAVPGGAVSSNEPSLRSLQKVESGKGHGGRKSRAMEGVGRLGVVEGCLVTRFGHHMIRSQA